MIRGPVPKSPEQRRRRNAALPLVLLPAGGRTGPVPVFPLPALKSEVLAGLEAQIWVELWATPQAVEWERGRWLRDVALYARFKAAAELGNVRAAVEARHWGDRLGLTPQAMLRLRWEIAADEPGPVGSRSDRSRMRVVATDGPSVTARQDSGKTDGL